MMLFFYIKSFSAMPQVDVTNFNTVLINVNFVLMSLITLVTFYLLPFWSSQVKDLLKREISWIFQEYRSFPKEKESLFKRSVISLHIYI